MDQQKYRERDPSAPTTTSSMPSTPALHPALEGAFTALNAAEVKWCVLRVPSNFTAPRGDVDLLIDRSHLSRARGVLEHLGFVMLSPWTRVSDVHFATYHASTDRWIKLHVVTDLSFGRFHALETREEAGCLARRYCDGPVAVLAPDDAFWALLLHCLIDKGTISSDRRIRLQDMADSACADSPLAQLVTRLSPSGWDAERLIQSARAGDWGTLEQFRLLFIPGWRRRHSGRVYRRIVREVAARLTARLLVPLRRPGLSVALLGPDGSGKSTLAEGLQSAFFSPVRSIHMALADYQIPRWARIRVPKVGAPGRFLVTLWRYLQGQYYRTRGWLAIFDRYTYDVLLPSEQQHTRVKQALRWLLAHTFPAPDVVILLDAPGHVVHARKGEYDPEHMEAHRQHLLRLRQRLPQLQVVDATQSKDAVRVDATSRIWQQYVARHGEKM